MKTHKFFLILSVIVILLTGCRKRYTIDLEQFKQGISKNFESFDSTQKKFFLQIYDTVSPRPYWYNTPKDFKEKLLVLRSFENRAMSEHGISNARFYADSINRLIVSIDTLHVDYDKMAKLDMLMSKSYFDYCAAMKFGCFDPRKIYPKDYFIKVKRPDSAFIQTTFKKIDDAASLKKHLTEIQPQSKIYQTLQNELRYLYKFKDSTFTRIPMFADNFRLKKGERNYAVSLLARRMMITGRLPYDARYDTIRTLSDSILNALNRYRNRYNLEKMSALDNPTIKMLNKEFGTLYWTVAANMERLRWTPLKEVSHKHVWVNVATARLRMMRGDSVAGSMAVGVGKADEHETPLLMGKMYEVVVNPIWTVPKSIILNEISKKGNAGAAAYILRNNMKVYKGNVVQDPQTVPWEKLNEKFQPYTVVQDAGPDNSLGRLKFNFDNPYSIYLHDTNSKGFFSAHTRTVSHGCVRVQDPLRLAFFCLADVDTTNHADVKNRKFLEDRIRFNIGINPIDSVNKNLLLKMGEKAKLARVALKPGVTVLIDYRTCFVDKNGKLFFTEDYYKMDDVLMKRLSKAD